MNLKAQFLKNNNMKVLTGGGGQILPSTDGSRMLGAVTPKKLGHGNTNKYQPKAKSK
jgi:hypothetical protein